WNEAEANQRRPVVPDVLPIARAARENTISIDRAERRIELGESIALEPSGLAKGYIIDRTMGVLQEELPQGTAFKVDIGGDARYGGAPPGESGWLVGVANPVSLADNDYFVGTIELNDAAVATSGHQTRTWSFGDQEFSQVLDTR